MGAYLREVICKKGFLGGAYSRISTLRRTDHGSPRTDWCSKAHLHYNRSYCRRARAADWRLALKESNRLICSESPNQLNHRVM